MPTDAGCRGGSPRGPRRSAGGQGAVAIGRTLTGLALLALLLSTPAVGQVLSSPLPPGKGEPMLPGTIDRPGQGPGFHSPDSPIPPLREREGVLSWAVLAAVPVRQERTRVRPLFTPQLQALDGQRVRVQGFMMPLDAAPRQTHFLLSGVPTSCPFCIPAGPEGMVEVKARVGVRQGLDPVLVEGRLQLLSDDPHGLFYRLVEAIPIEH